MPTQARSNAGLSSDGHSDDGEKWTDPCWKAELFGFAHVRKVELIESTRGVDIGVG